MSVDIRVVHTLTWDPPEVAGGVVTIENGSTLYLHGIGVPVIWDILTFLNLSHSSVYSNVESAMELVSNGNADIGSLILSHQTAYLKLGVGSNISYLHPLSQEPSNIYFRQPPSSSIKNISLRPFSTNVWLTTFMIFFLSTCLSIVANKSLQSLETSFKHWTCLLDTLVQIFVLLVSRVSLHKKPIRKAERSQNLIILVATFLSTYLISLYTAKIVSYFVLEDNMIKTSDDLVKYHYTISTWSPMHIDILFSNPKTREYLYANAVPMNGESRTTLGKVVGKGTDDPRYALLSQADGFYPQLQFDLQYSKEICRISYIQSQTKTPRFPFIQRNSPYREAINLKIVQMIERGLNHRLRRNTRRKYIFICPTQPKELFPLSLKHLYFGFIVLSVGSCIAVVQLCVIIGKCTATA